MKVIDTLGDYFFYLEHTKKIKKWTLVSIRTAMKHFCNELWMKDTKDLTITHIMRFESIINKKKQKLRWWWFSDLPLQESYKHTLMIKVKAYITWLSWEWLLGRLKPNDIHLKREVLRNIEYLNKKEIGLLFDTLEKEYDRIMSWMNHIVKVNFLCCRAMLYLYYYSWLRNTAWRSVFYKDIDLENLRWSVLEKYDKYVTFTFTERVRDAIIEYLEYQKRYFETDPNWYLFLIYPQKFKWLRAFQPTINKPNEFIRDLWKKAWIQKVLHIHLLRHSCATHLLDWWANIREVQEKLAHKNLDTTMLYTHVSNNRLAEITQNLLV